MKKIALIITTLVTVLVMTGCEVPTEAKDNTSKVEDYINMIRVCSNADEQIFYDNNTGVMYYQYYWSRCCCGLTPIYNTDGTLKIYEGWEKR